MTFDGKIPGKTLFWGFVVFVATLAADQWTKTLVMARPSLALSPIVVIPDFFNLTRVRNTGAAWGMLSGRNGLLLAIALVVTALLLRYHRYITEGRIERYWALALILGGIVGNSLDRVFRGSVVDFLDFYIGARHWPAFNVADSALCVGAAIIVLSSLLAHRSVSRDSGGE